MPGGPSIDSISTNSSDYPAEQVPLYEKFEVTFNIDTDAENLQLPYDAAPPAGLQPKIGITVNALFTPDDWNTVFSQPAFYYQEFQDEIRSGQGWFYPTDNFWKVRFAPDQTGNWQFKLTAQDASGITETQPFSFSVGPSDDKGFIKVSSTDPRYFEFSDGTTFHGMGFGHSAHADDPVLKNEPEFQIFQQNHIDLLRVWISGIYGSAWNEYLGGRNLYDGYLPRPGILPFYDPIRDRATMTMRLDYEPDGDTGWFDACRFQFWDDPEAVKQNTNYRIRIKYRGLNIFGPRNTAYPNYGFVGKIGGWHPDCYEPGTSTVVTNYGLNNSDWQYVEGVWASGSNNFLPRIHMALENVIEGEVYVDSISVQEELGNGQYGPEIMVEPSMQYELYFSEESAYALDKAIELAEQYDIYLKLVIMEKEDKIYSKLEDNGDFVLSGPDNTDGFYGVGRTLNKTRWLQQAWWRYLQARWGYSPHVHSWELTNEGDPFNENHYALTDELGKFMHCGVFDIPVGAGDGDKCTYNHPNDHMVTTSFWHSFPGEQFWANPKYPNVDYADVHAYISTGWQDDPTHESDAAKFHLDYSADVRSNIDWYAEQTGIPTKPIVRGETGIDYVDQQSEQPDLALDTQGTWLHNFLWSTLDAGALTELYWWGDNITNQPGPDGQPGLYEIYGNFYNFVNPVTLNNGHYQDAKATTDNSNLRVVGQKDLTNGCAHLWLQNKNHTWKNVVDAVSIPTVAGTVEISGFQAGENYAVEWWDTYQPDQSQQIIQVDNLTAQNDGSLLISVDDLGTDMALKISSGNGCATNQ